MTVYVVMRGYYQDIRISCVCRTKKKAQAIADLINLDSADVAMVEEQDVDDVKPEDITVHAFLHFDTGEHVYTLVADGGLLHYDPRVIEQFGACHHREPFKTVRGSGNTLADALDSARLCRDEVRGSGVPQPFVSAIDEE